ncbi:MAG TPA: tetratricopeptide repeat protein [bacterium]|nr:tetratricopeptide repeat protein [bacterium]
MLKPKRRISKKELKQDDLLEFLYKAERFIRQHKKLLSYTLLGIVVIVAMGLMMYNSRQNAEMQAAAALGSAQTLYDQGQYQQVIDELEPVIADYRGTRSAGVGVFYIASAYDRQGNESEAQKYYRQYLDRYDNDPLLSASTLASLGAIHAEQGNHTEALDLYRKALRRAPHKFLAQQFTLAAAEVAFNSGRTSNAQSMLTALLENDDLTTDIRTEARELLAMIEVGTAQ